MATTCTSPISTKLDLRPPVLNLCLYHGQHDNLTVTRENEATGETLPMTGWSSPAAVIRTRRGGADVVDLLPTLIGDQIDITITPAMKTAFAAFGASQGVWEVDAVDDSGQTVTLVHGTVQLADEVVT